MRISDWSSDVCSSDLWGDPLFADSPEFDPLKQSAAAQVRQFGYNNDFIGYVGLPFGSDNPDHGLLCVNLEYTSPELMVPGAEDASAEAGVAIEMEAQRGGTDGVRRENGRWSAGPDGRNNSPNTPGGP